MSHYLGVDGGGTKTAFVLADETGTPLAEVTGPGTYYFPVGIDLVERVLRDGVARVTAQAGVQVETIDRAFVALPGHGEASGDIAELDAITRRVLGHDRFDVGNDAVAGWAGSLGGVDGINIVAGTGSIAYGEWRGAAHRAGGWSEVFGDEGSAYWVAVRGLNAFSRMSDGRRTSGPLHAAIRQRVGAATDLDVIGVVVDGWGAKRDRIASLAPAVTEAARAGDTAAQAIVRDAGAELAALVGAVRAGLGVAAGETLPVSYSGGMFSDPGIRAAFEAALPPDSELREPVAGPALGAALYARRRAEVLGHTASASDR
ncbi:BadF/BadG/BcrA/BcrD ATPase family protein [Amnibacterium sp. CER49]|uniref:N-acetylglucosamine kinase n=1 Tax=Amnibacterium sp. CER49 TaxID=3039161 RepID=UPI00244B2D92|nr:BadF/BadG/BcrA/BcrD ATPase family protein [Amnibacterium sp. CER49]MDH2442597.1 BadF/BadG/BcrA/BcrD ATPase family protein [Amnibacterium sp. CER49]